MDGSPTDDLQLRADAVSAEGIATLLAMARRRINEGNPSLALKAVVIALRARGGEQAVLQALGRARELYENGLRANAATDELSALFAECALAESQPQAGEAASPLDTVLDSSMQTTTKEAGLDAFGGHSHPILAESGRLQVVKDASADGSSFVCVLCGGLVSNLRKDEHLSFWCSARS